MTLIYVYQGRNIEKDITLVDANGDTITPDAGNIIRAIIGRIGEAAKLIVTSSAATANGSSFTKGAANRLKLTAADLSAIDPGTYSLMIDLWDSADSAWKEVDRQVIHIEGKEG